MNNNRTVLAVLLAAALHLPAGAALAAPTANADRDDERTVEFAVEASRPAPNDEAVATLYVEQSGADAAALATRVNRAIAAALDTARGHADIKVQSGNTSTWPVYDKNGGKIEAWRMRSEIRLETRNVAALSELIGKLQGSLAVAQLSMQPSAETRRKATDEATVDAIRAFEQRAALISSSLGKRYRLRHINISDSGARPPIYARMRAAPMMAEAASAPLEGGESEVGVTINGRIELVE